MKNRHIPILVGVALVLAVTAAAAAKPPPRAPAHDYGFQRQADALKVGLGPTLRANFR